MQINEIRALIATEMEQVVSTIAEQFGSDVDMIKEVSQYITGGGGKRLRPILAILSAKAFGYEGQHHIYIAAIVELIHTATLLHDDVVDNSSLRRGKKTANVVFGNEASILVGDFLYSRAFQMMVTISSMRVMEILANASNTIAEGEVMQLINCHNPTTDEKTYMETILRKTAKLFEAAAELGAVISEQNDLNQKAMTHYGMHVGLAFQLVDDALDYGLSNHDIGKTIGDDLAEGKPTLPLIHILNQGTEEQKKLVQQAIQTSTEADLSAIQQAIKDTNALSYTLSVAEKQAALAIECLHPVKQSKYKDALIALAHFAVKRDY